MKFIVALIIAVIVIVATQWGRMDWAVLVVAFFPVAVWPESGTRVDVRTTIDQLAHWILPVALITGYLMAVDAFISLGWMSIPDIVRIQATDLSVLGILILASFGIHVILYQSVYKTLKEARTIWRFTAYVGMVAISALIVFREWDIVFLSLLCGGVYFLLMDLFVDLNESSITWAMVWMIVIGSFITLTAFYFSNLRSPVSAAKIPLLNAFSFFSITFIISALILMVLALFNGRWRFLPVEWDFNFSHRRQLRNRIQLAILLTLLFSFVAIGFVSVYHLRLSGDLNNTFIQALLNTYVFLFLIGFAISMSLAEYIRNPLIELGQTLKAVKLIQDNEKIIWEGNDEIGNLINEYNLMIDKLQDNAVLLARTERDSAWREMAKQVAHEIKNPLTPMKLSLQHLEKTIKSRPEESLAVTLRMCETLMNQVENLRQIADEFSNFGSLPKANNERILLNDIVETIHDLFRKRADMNINLIEPIDDIGVYADKNHLVRVLNNLVKNSIQSIPEERKGQIELKLYSEGNKAIIRVRDNGCGIPENMRDEIFKPQFTTKSSGSGLGLAISANMIDAIGGRIYFESSENNGTDFFVELPLVRSKFSENSTRISLDEL